MAAPPPGGPPPPIAPGPPGAPAIAVAQQPARRTSTFRYDQSDVDKAVGSLLSNAKTLVPTSPDAPKWDMKVKVVGMPPPKPVSSNGDRHAIAVAGAKGSKTIASLAVKTNRCGALPRPEGSLAVVMHLDNQAPNSVCNFLYQNQVVIEEPTMPLFIGLAEPIGDYKARVKRSDPACSAYVRDVIYGLKRKLAERGDVGLFLHDGYGDTVTQFGNYVAAYESGLDSPIKVEKQQWFPRREMFSDMMMLGRAAVIPGGFFVVNMPDGGLDADREAADTPAKQAFLARRLKKEGFAERDPPSKVLVYRENNENLSAIFHMRVGKDQSGAITYAAEVWEGRLARIGIRTGDIQDVTMGSIGRFCE